MELTMEQLENYIFSRIDKNNLIQVEKANRYIGFVKRINDLSEDVEKDGATVATNNGPQVFLKSHPALGEISKLSKALLDIERSFDFKDESIPKVGISLI